LRAGTYFQSEKPNCVGGFKVLFKLGATWSDTEHQYFSVWLAKLNDASW
jgi:hypothetical protein